MEPLRDLDVFPLLIGLGSNLGDRLAALRLGLTQVVSLPQTQLLRVSSVYETPPFGGVPQPNFLNAVAVLSCGLDPEVLLNCLKRIELEVGRAPGGIRWGPRALDLDILSHGAHVLSRPALTLPHAGLVERAFVLVPLVEVWSGRALPGISQEGQRVESPGTDDCSWATPEQLVQRLPEVERAAVCPVAPPSALWTTTPSG